MEKKWILSWQFKELRDECIRASYEATHAPARVLAFVFNVSGRTITNVLEKFGIKVEMGRPKKPVSDEEIVGFLNEGQKVIAEGLKEGKKNDTQPRR